MSESEPSYLYDVFISYSHRDADWVTKTLVPRLEQGGLRVCTDRDFVPGKPAVLNIEESIRNSRKIILVLSPNWVESQWTHFEAQLAQQDDPAGIRARTIPVLWKPCNIPENLRPLTWIDFTRKSNLDHAWRTLLKAVGLPDDKIRSPRSKPVVRHPVTRPKRKRSAHWRRAKKRKNLFLFSV
ncbi:MAG: toll/interleukin-1 receptor domain-containing protein, partial [Anaerolineales bacterium]|nr:toll/interleukin-1 receptor domain-containing protein [Anaerolineales bacterium]MDW8227940.1 toll/interleukin-1 receptor domain-containing protein [Anaerolineales bacterium]